MSHRDNHLTDSLGYYQSQPQTVEFIGGPWDGRKAVRHGKLDAVCYCPASPANQLQCKALAVYRLSITPSAQYLFVGFSTE